MSPTRRRILFVDDEAPITQGLQARLHAYRDQWELLCYNDPLAALAFAEEQELDTVVADIRMPGLDGLALIARLRAMPHHAATPIIVLTGSGEKDLKRRALDAGADDLLNKPVILEDLVARLRSALRLKEQQQQLQAANRELESRVELRTKQLATSRLDIILRLGRAAEYRDEDTGNHVVRVGLYAYVLAKGLGLRAETAEQLVLAAPLHDVGKIGVPDRILLARRKLTDDEWVVMKSHAEIGHAILTEPSFILDAFSSITGREAKLIDTNPLVDCAATIALTHHEKYGGHGYPCGLAGEDIPIEGRIVALADVYDALSSERPYKAAFPEEQVLAILAESAGDHLDPAVHEVFVRELDTFRQIREAHRDRPVQGGQNGGSGAAAA